METKKVSNKLLMRLPLYLNYIKSLPVHTKNISATKVAKALTLGEVMVRKDLAKVSDGGRRKVGYNRESLIRDIEDFLNVNRTTCAIIIGAGKLGQALLDYDGFEKAGLHVVAGFDSDLSKKKTERGKSIYPMDILESFCSCYDVRVGILTVPAESAQIVCDAMIACGIKAIWNFSPILLKTPAHVVVKNENLALSLAALRMQINDHGETALR